jgi:hypothetical protein
LHRKISFVLFAANQQRNSSIGCKVGFRAAIAGGKPYLIDGNTI